MKTEHSFHEDKGRTKNKETSNFKAVKELVETDNHLRVVRNRLKVLHSNENKNAVKIANQVAMIQKIQQVREATTQHHQLVYVLTARSRLAMWSYKPKPRPRRAKIFR